MGFYYARKSRVLAVSVGSLAFSLCLASGAWADSVTTEAGLFAAVNADTSQIIDLGQDITVHGQLASTFGGTLNGGNYTIYLAPTIPNEGDPTQTVALPLFGTLAGTAVIKGLNLGLDKLASGGVSGQGMLANAALSSSNIIDVHVSGSVTSGDGYADTVGGLIGSNEGTISGSSADVKVLGPGIVGGLVGANRGSIEYSISLGAATGNNSVGGLVGYNNGNILDSASQSIVTGTKGGENPSDSVGGLVGWNDSAGTISNSMAKSETSGEGNNFGGLVGKNVGEIKNSLSLGETISTETGDVNIGGLVGLNYGHISNSASEGNVKAEGNDVAGLVGTNSYSGLTEKSWSMSNVLSVKGNTVGGLVAKNLGIIQNTFSGGKVQAPRGHGAGGLVGENYYSGQIESSASKSIVLGISTVGGLVGFNTGQISKSWASVGTVTGSIETGGLVGWNMGNITNSLAYGNVFSSDSSIETGSLIGWLFPLGTFVTNSDSFGNAGILGLKIGNLPDWTDGGPPTETPGPKLELTSDEDLLNADLATSVWNKKDAINNGLPYLVNMLGKKIYLEPAPQNGSGFSYFRTFTPPIAETPLVQNVAEQKITKFLSSGGVKPTPADFKSMGIIGVTSANLSILLKLLKDLKVTSLDPELIAKQIEIANALLAKQKKAKQVLKVKKASFESSPWISLIPSLLLG